MTQGVNKERPRDSLLNWNCVQGRSVVNCKGNAMKRKTSEREDYGVIRESLFSLPFLKKEVFYGSYKHMQYRIAKKEEELEVCLYPGPFSFDYTPEEQKEYKVFSFSEEGYEQAKDYLEQAWSSKDWEALAKDNFG